MTLILAFIGSGLVLFTLASVLFGKAAVQREEQQASADALAMAATTIAMREGVDEVCGHPAMEALLRSNMAQFDRWEGDAPCPQVIREDLGDGRYRLRFRSAVSGTINNPFHNAFDQHGGDIYTEDATAEIKEHQFTEVEERRPKLVLVLDYSGSMGVGFGDGSRMDALREAVIGLIGQRLRVEYGLVMFNSGVILEVPVDANDRQIDILDAMHSRGPGGGTKYGAPISAAANKLTRLEDTGWYILFVTDGYPNDGSGPSLRAADTAKARDVGIFTLNVGGGGAQRDLLVDMSGTREDPGGPNNRGYYFSAANAGQLQQTFRQIVANILCTIGPLEPAPDLDHEELHVFMVSPNGEEQPLDQTPNIGGNPNALAYNYIRDENKIRLTQRVCDQVLDFGASITARFGAARLVD